MSQDIKLPRIDIPTFNGEYQEWTSFYDAFYSLIDSNPSVPDVSKMHYLRNSLSGSAFRMISKLPVTEANYKIAWKMLTERFHNTRLIVNACLNSFINQPTMKNGSANSLRSLIDTSKESIQCIESLNIPVDEWDPIVGTFK